jgi:hypothetical protein
MKTAAGRLLDLSALSVSGLCLAHCLLLPVAAALTPALFGWAETETVHLVFVLVAAPLSAAALLARVNGRRAPISLILLGTLGVLGLAFGVVGWPTRSAETAVTVLGSLFLAGAHYGNWRRISADTGQTHGHGPHPPKQGR